MNIALFGGTFDPIHSGHLRAARAAVRRFKLHRVLLVPSGIPPHKPEEELTPYVHRFAMVALAARGETALVPSTLEAPKSDGHPNYSVETAEAAQRLVGRGSPLYFILGVDSFLDLPNWKDYHRLIELADFIVVSRPGFDSRQLLATLGDGQPGAGRKIGSSLVQPDAAGVHLLGGVHAPIASRQIRRAAARGQSLAGLVPPLVEEYIVKESLYRPARAARGGK